MDHIQMSIISEIAEPEIRDFLLTCYNKRIPEKIIIKGLGQRYCPSCGCGNQTKKFCGDCGQLLNWRDADE